MKLASIETSMTTRSNVILIGIIRLLSTSSSVGNRTCAGNDTELILAFVLKLRIKPIKALVSVSVLVLVLLKTLMVKLMRRMNVDIRCPASISIPVLV